MVAFKEFPFSISSVGTKLFEIKAINKKLSEVVYQLEADKLSRTIFTTERFNPGINI